MHARVESNLEGLTTGFFVSLAFVSLARFGLPAACFSELIVIIYMRARVF